MFLKFFTIVLLFILTNAIDVPNLNHESWTYRFITGLELRIVVCSLYLTVISILERFLEKNSHVFSQNTYDLWRFVFVRTLALSSRPLLDEGGWEISVRRVCDECEVRIRYM